MLHRRLWLVLVLAVPSLLTITGLGAPQDAPLTAYVPPKQYLCFRASTSITVDGKLDDPAWRNADATDPFVDIEGQSKPAPRFHTSAKMLWDDEFFYVTAQLQEPHVWATLTQHDAVIFQDNDFEVFIDPNGDNHEYYECEINALNTGWDLFLPRPYKDGGVAMNAWEIPGLKSAVHVQGTLNDPRDTDRGWSLEIAFPWKVLAEMAHQACPPRDGDQWRVNFSRVQWDHEVLDQRYRKVQGKREHNWVWSPQGVVDMHRPESWGYVQFSTAPPGQAAFRPDPAAPARQLLHRVYYAQHQFRTQHHRWARRVEELHLTGLAQDFLTAPLQMQLTDELFQVTAELKLPGGKTQRWHIRQDSYLWSN